MELVGRAGEEKDPSSKARVFRHTDLNIVVHRERCLAAVDSGDLLASSLLLDHFHSGWSDRALRPRMKSSLSQEDSYSDSYRESPVVTNRHEGEQVKDLEDTLDKSEEGVLSALEVTLPAQDLNTRLFNLLCYGVVGDLADRNCCHRLLTLSREEVRDLAHGFRNEREDLGEHV